VDPRAVLDTVVKRKIPKLDKLRVILRYHTETGDDDEREIPLVFKYSTSKKYRIPGGKAPHTS
jgi:hypothetical protein